MKIIDNKDGKNYGDTIAHPNQKADYDGYISLKYRGNSSFNSSDKKPYGFKTLSQTLEEGGKKQKVKLLGMGKDNDWAFLAPFSDKSMIRDVLTFELGRPYLDIRPIRASWRLFSTAPIMACISWQSARVKARVV